MLQSVIYKIAMIYWCNKPVVPNLFCPKIYFSRATFPRSTSPVSISRHSYHFQPAVANFTILSCCRKTTQTSHHKPFLSQTYTLQSVW